MTPLARVVARVVVSAGVFCTGCHPTPEPRMVRGDVEIRRLGTAPTGLFSFGTGRPTGEGDWLIQSPALRVVVAGAGITARPEPVGAVIQVSREGLPGTEAIRSVETLVQVSRHDVTLSEEVFNVVLVHGHPVLRVTAYATASGTPGVQGTRLQVTREYSMDAPRGALRVRTRVTNLGTVASAPVAFGSRIGWGGAAPFAPGLGVVPKGSRGRAPWVGLATHGTAVLWTHPDGDLDLTFTEDNHDTTRIASFTEVISTRDLTLAPGTHTESEDVLIVARGDLTAVARAAASLRGDAVTDVPLEVEGAGEDPPVVTISSGPTGHALLLAEPTHGRESLPLPVGDYFASATATGHAPADPVRFAVTPGHTPEPVRLRIPPGAHIRVAASDSVTDRDLPVRVVVRGIAPTPDPHLGPNSRAAGAGCVVVVPGGRTEIAVPPGKYSVTVSHGPEWTIARMDTTVTETLRGDVTVRLAHAVPMAEWMACDLHVHANPSFDSRVTLEDRVASLVVEGIGFATPTEHNVVGDYTAGVAALPQNVPTPLLWVPAVEVTTDRSAQPWGHFNVYPYVPVLTAPGGGPPPFLDTTPRQIFRAARANNPDAVIQVNHPRMQPNIGYFSVTGLDTRTNRAVSPEYDPNYDAIEVFNGFYVGHIEFVEAGLTDWFNLLNTGARYVATGSSDSHQIAYQWAGYPRTYVDVSAQEEPRSRSAGRGGLGRVGVGPAGAATADTATVIRSLRAGHAFVTSGPMLFLDADGSGPGDSHPLSARRMVTFRVRVRAAPWIDVNSVDLIRDGQRVTTLAVRPSTEVVRLDTEVVLPVDPGSWVMATARGSRGSLDVVLPDSHGQPFAFTNPIFFDRALQPGRDEP